MQKKGDDEFIKREHQFLVAKRKKQSYGNPSRRDGQDNWQRETDVLN